MTLPVLAILETGLVVLWVTVVLMVLAIIPLHYRKRKTAKQGLLPFHVMVISTAHLGYMWLSTLAVMDSFPSDPYGPRTIGYVVFSVLTIVALTIIGGFQMRRIK